MQKETSKIITNSLYIVATPIGNLKDITLRALDTLTAADIIICEDTRITKKLLSHYNILGKKLISYGKHNLNRVTDKIILLLKDNKTIALVSDAGTPLISDPGAKLIQECYKNNIKVTIIPGASALISAVALSGLNSTSFYFGGFLENKTSAIKKQLQAVKSISSSLVFFVASNKLAKTLESIIEVFSTTQKIIIARELTKIFEEVIIDTAEDLLQKLQTQKLLGETVLILPNTVPCITSVDKTDLTTMLKKYLKEARLKDAITLTANYYNQKGITISKKELYKLGLTIKTTTK